MEQSCVVWHSSLNQEDSDNLEIIKKSAIRIILQGDVVEYIDGLHKLNLDTLYERRVALCKNFAEKTAKHEKLKNMFPKNDLSQNMKTRNPEVYKETSLMKNCKNHIEK